MLNKKIMVLTIFLVSLLAITAVSAEDNATSDVVSVNETAVNIVKNTADDVVSVNNIENDNISINQDILKRNESQNEFLLDNPANIISNTNHEYLSSIYPLYGQYNVKISDTIVTYKSGSINMNIHSVSTSDYKYYFYLRIYNSKNKMVVSQLYYGTERTKDIMYDLSSNPLSVGTYTIDIMNYHDNMILREAKLTVWDSSIYPSHSDYSVRISNTNFYYNSGGSINMRIGGWTPIYYKYYYYLKIYDSNNIEKFSKLYYNNSYDSNPSFTINPGQLKWGIYMIKIINYYDNEVMNTARLTVMPNSESPTYTDYSVRVSNTVLEAKYGGKVLINITPASLLYKNQFDFELLMYDSNGKARIGKTYVGTQLSEASFTDFFSIRGGVFTPGDYLIKVYNSHDGELMDTATVTLIRYPNYSDYSVDISDTKIQYGSNIGIKMSIVPATTPSYKYNYYLKIYDLNNQEVISKLYSSIKSTNSVNYIDSGKLSVGSYTMKIINVADNKVMDTAKLTVESNPFFQCYSVKVNDAIMEYGVNNANVSISINPTDSSKSYSYSFYLRIFDSNNVEKKGWRYYSNNLYTDTNYKYLTINCTDLNPGKYTIKIISAEDNRVLTTSNLIVKHTSHYFVSVENIVIDYGSNNIPIPISLKSNHLDKLNAYKFYLRIFDTNDVKQLGIICSGTFNNTHIRNVVVNTTGLIPGDYTIKVINFEDNTILSTSILKVEKTNANPAENQTKNTTQENITIIDNSKITASNVKVTYTASSYYSIKVYGADGKPANGVSVKITGKISKNLSTTNGIAKFKVTQVPGTYKITITSLDKSVTKTITVKHLVTLKTVDVKKSAKKLVLQASLGKVDGKYLNKKTVTFKFNGKIYKAKTNSKGVAKVTIKSSILKNLKVGKKVTYQATYLKDTVKKTTKVKK